MKTDVMLDTEALLEKYYAGNREARDLLLRHSRQVRDYALALLDRRPELRGQVDRGFVAEAAMLHDIGIGQCDAPGIHCHGTHLYIEHGYLGAELLRAEGLPRHALVCERHTGMGLSREMVEERGWPLPRRDMRPVTLEEKLVCYADKFFSKSHPDAMYTPEVARQKVARFGEEEGRRFDALRGLFGE